MCLRSAANRSRRPADSHQGKGLAMASRSSVTDHPDTTEYGEAGKKKPGRSARVWLVLKHVSARNQITIARRPRLRLDQTCHPGHRRHDRRTRPD